MPDLYDARVAAWLAAWDRIEAIQELKISPKNRVAAEPLSDVYWAAIAEAAIYAQLANADIQTGMHAGGVLAARDKEKRHAAFRREVLRAEASDDNEFEFDGP